MALNVWHLSGRLTRDAWTADSGKVVKFTLAVSRGISSERLKKAQEAGEKLKDTDFFELTLFKNSKGRDNTKFFDLVSGFKQGDELTVTVIPQNSAPQRRTNKEGIPEIVYKDLYLIESIDNIRRFKKSDDVTVDEDDIEDDPIVVTQTKPQKYAGAPVAPAGGNPPSDW